MNEKQHSSFNRENSSKTIRPFFNNDFVAGMASVFDLGGSHYDEDVCSVLAQSEQEEFWNDWAALGEDMWNAIRKVYCKNQLKKV